MNYSAVGDVLVCFPAQLELEKRSVCIRGYKTQVLFNRIRDQTTALEPAADKETFPRGSELSRRSVSPGTLPALLCSMLCAIKANNSTSLRSVQQLLTKNSIRRYS